MSSPSPPSSSNEESQVPDSQGGQEAPDRPEGLVDLPPGGDTATGVPRTLSQLESEKDEAFLCFLLWVMQNPQDRSNRLIARSMGVAEPTVRYWRKRHKWRARAARVPRAEFHALREFRKRLDEIPGELQAARTASALDVILQEAGFTSLRREVQRQRAALPSHVGGTAPPGEPPPAGGTALGAAASTPVPTSELAPQELDHLDVQRHLREVRDKIVRDHLRHEDVRRQILLIDGVMGLIARKVQDGSLRVQVSDIPGLLKARAILTGLPGDVDTTPTQVDRSQHLHQHVHLTESVRMRDARKSGDQGEVLDAMTAEVQDLQIILGAIPRGGDQ